MDKREYELDPFAEIEIVEAVRQILAPEPIGSPVAVTPQADPVREKFYAMRRIGRDNMSFNGDNSRAFYRQGMFMKDFEDDFTESVPFTSYFPYYQQMSYEQLRTYFTWRSGVRRGNVAETSTSYVFLYIYELLSNIGCANPQDGLNKLMDFWRTYRVFSGVADNYLLDWLKDYHIYYPLAQNFGEFAAENNLQRFYPDIFCYSSEQADSFDLFADISSYNIKDSKFYTDENAGIIADCFYFILNKLRAIFKKKGKQFENSIFFTVRASIWRPFDRALFYSTLKQADRQVTVSEKETYTCVNNIWTYRTNVLLDGGKKLIGYVMKEMEAELRGTLKFARKITADPNKIDDKLRAKFGNLGVIFPQFIKESVAEFYKIYTRKTVSVDFWNLHQIRHEALQTQEKLIVEEVEPQPEPVWEKETKPEAQTVAVQADMWEQLACAFTPVEREALRLALAGEDIRAFAAINMLMPEVLADGINEKAMDFVADNILELEENGQEILFCIYDEYVGATASIVRKGLDNAE